ncbi:MAG: ABC transporter permease, partial [bacterium]
MRFYSALLRLYPASFRAEYGEEMRAIHRKRLRESSGFFARLLLWLDTIGEVVSNAAAAHWDILRQDLTYTARTLVRSPGFTLTAVLVTALGIGANTAAFSVADFVLIRPLPYANPERLVKLWQQSGGSNTGEASPLLYSIWKRQTTTFEAMGAYYTRAVNLVGEGEPRRLERAVVTADLLPILGVKPIRGSMLTSADERSGASGIMLGYDVWQGQFGGAEDIIGRRLLIDGRPLVVIGVMPKDFHFPTREIALWTAMSQQEQSDNEFGNNYWEVLARLKRDVPIERASAEMEVISRRIEPLYPQDMEKVGVSVMPLRDQFSRQSRLLLLALCGAAVCVLLIACANLANLLIARSLTRRRELLVRSALGAGRERLVRQSITESFILAALGGALGVGIAVVAVPLLARLVPTTLPIAQSPAVDPRILLFAGLLTAITGIGFGVLPAWRSSGTNDLSGLREGARSGGGRRERARSALVVAEVMASVVLLISAGLLMRALVKLHDVDPGFRAENVLALRTALPSPRYDTTARRAAFYRDVLTEVRAIPGVKNAAYISGLPMSTRGGIWSVTPVGRPLPNGRPGSASSRFITSGFFDALSIPLRHGRDVSDADDASRPHVAVVSESFAAQYFPNEDPIGQRFTFLGDIKAIVGVVGDVRVRGPEQQSEPQVYLANKQVDDNSSPFYFPKELVVRSTIPATTLVPAVRQIVQRVDPEQPISNVHTMSEIVSDLTAARSVQVRVLSAFAVIAFLLAAVGIHGLLSFSVSSRQHEIGVRMALGAQRGEIVAMVMRQGAILAAFGVVPGIAIAYVAARAMQSLLAGIQPGDAVTFGAATMLCVVMTL